jgi:hypothetical protein
MLQGFIEGVLLCLFLSLISWIFNSIKNRFKRKNSREEKSDAC